MKRLWYFWLVVWVAHTAYGQFDQPLVVGASAMPSGELSLINALYRFEDSTGQATIDQVIRLRERGQFTPSVSPTYRQDFGYNTSVQWLFFELESVRKADLLLEIEYANIDQVALFEVSKGRVRSLALTGDQYNFSHRPYLNNNYVFPLRLPVGTTAGYYLRFGPSHAILSFFIRLWPQPVFLQNDRDEYLIWGIYIGVICIVVIITIVMLLATKDRIYGWYALYLHFMTMHLFSDAGLAFQYLWPNTPVLNEYAPVYLYVWLGIIAQLTFMQFFIHQTPQNSRVHPWITGFKVIVGTAFVGIIGIHVAELDGRDLYLYKVVASATRYFVIGLVLLTALSLYEQRPKRQPEQLGGQKEKLVQYYTYALAVQFTGFMLVSLINLCQDKGWALPFDVLTYVIMGITISLDIVFFSYGLAYRYRSFRQANRALELNLLEARQETQRRVIDSLEEERCRLAQDLHDDVGATLATAKGYLSVITRHNKSAPMLHAQTLLDQAATELRAISHQLMPKNFEQLGLANAIEEAIRKASSGPVQFQFISLGKPSQLERQSERLVFSMATDLIRQVQRNGATAATLQLIYHPDRLNLSVEDNGRNAAANDWQNLHAKAQYLKANLLIDANEQGTSFMLSVPF